MTTMIKSIFSILTSLKLTTPQVRFMILRRNDFRDSIVDVALNENERDCTNNNTSKQTLSNKTQIVGG